MCQQELLHNLVCVILCVCGSDRGKTSCREKKMRINIQTGVQSITSLMLCASLLIINCKRTAQFAFSFHQII